MENASIDVGEFGWFVEWYADDDDSSGYGDNARVCRWYGTYQDCLKRARRSAPSSRFWVSPEAIDRRCVRDPLDFDCRY